MNLNKNRQILLTTLILLCAAMTARAQSITWTEIEPGIWKGVAGKPEAYNLLTASGAKTYEPGLLQMGKAGFPLSQQEITATVADGKTFLRFPLEKEEQLYGFGLNFQTVHQR